MSKMNKITFNMVAAEMDEDVNAEVTFAGKHKELKIAMKRRLDFNDAMMFVRDIAASCVDVASGAYMPEAFDFSVKANTLVYYAGFSAPDNIKNAYSVIYGTNLYEVIRNEIDEEQYMALISAAKERINNDKEIMNNTQAGKMNDLIDKMDEVMSDGDSIVSELTRGDLRVKIDEMLAAMNALGNPSGNPDDAAKENNVVPLPVGDNA